MPPSCKACHLTLFGQISDFCYVDDFLLIADDHGSLQTAFDVMDLEAAELGLEFNPSKDVGQDSPLHEIEFLGILLRADVGDLALPENKRIKYFSLLQSFICHYKHSPTAPRSELESLTGKLGFAARTVHWGFLHLQYVYDTLYGGIFQQETVSLRNPEFWNDLRFWSEVLQQTLPNCGGVSRDALAPVDLSLQDPWLPHVYTNASSTIGWGAINQGDIIKGSWSDKDKEDHICWLELRAIRLAL